MKVKLILFFIFLINLKSYTLFISSEEIKKNIIGFTVNELEENENYKMVDTFINVKYYTDGKGNIFSQNYNNNKKYILKNKAKNIALITNSFSYSVSKELLNNSLYRKNFIKNLIYNLKKDNYDGVNIDFENIGISEKYKFSSFIKEIYEELKPLGYEVSVDVAAKTSDSNCCWGAEYDYKTIGENCDYIIIMTYDEHYSQSNPGPIASYNWVRNVISYALKLINPEKIVLGLPAYGYDWSIFNTKAYGLKKIDEMIKLNYYTMSFDDVFKSPYIIYEDEYNVTHTIWFENDLSISHKASLVNEFLLKGVAIWRLGLESENYLATIKNTIIPDYSKEYIVQNLPSKLELKKYSKYINKYLPVSHIPPYLLGKENYIPEDKIKIKDLFQSQIPNLYSENFNKKNDISKNIEYLYATSSTNNNTKNNSNKNNKKYISKSNYAKNYKNEI